jgi:hypothetical protein
MPGLALSGKMLIYFIGRMSLRGASGVGEVDRGTTEERIWSELGALPRSRRHGCGEVIEHQVHHNQRLDQTDGNRDSCISAKSLT